MIRAITTILALLKRGQTKPDDMPESEPRRLASTGAFECGQCGHDKHYGGRCIRCATNHIFSLKPVAEGGIPSHRVVWREVEQ